MTNHFHVRKAADSDLEKIYSYSVKEFGTFRAETYINKLVSTFQHLADNSRLGRDCNHIRPKLYAYEVESHSIYYTPTNDGIIIIRVLHKSMEKKLHI